MEIIEHEGKQYIKSEHKDEYIKSVIDEVTQLQSDIDEDQTKLDELEKTELIEDRKEHVIKTLSKYKDVNIEDSLKLFDFENEDSTNAMLDYYESVHQDTLGDPSAGFGPAKKAKSNSSNQLYEHGRQAARKVREGRR